jgi:hypothetical protein
MGCYVTEFLSTRNRYKFANGNLRCYYIIYVSSLPILWYFHCQNSSICSTAQAFVRLHCKGNIFSKLNKPPFHKRIWRSGGIQPCILNHHTTSLRVNWLIYIMIINNNENRKENFLVQVTFVSI